MIRVVLSTFSDSTAAESCIRALLDERLIACGTILPGASSIYRWKGTVENMPEVLVLFKLPAVRFDGFAARLRTLHPYETPEILSFDAGAVDAAYKEWVMDCCAPAEH